MGGSQESGANHLCNYPVLPRQGHSCLQRYKTTQLLMRLLQPPWLSMSAFICHIKGLSVGFNSFFLRIFVFAPLFCFMATFISYLISLRWCGLQTSTSGGGLGTSTNIRRMDARTLPQPWMA